MHDPRVEVIKLGIDFDLRAEIEARAKKPVELTDAGANALGRAIAAKKKDDAKKAEAAAKAQIKAEAAALRLAKCEDALALLRSNAAQNKATSAAEILAAAGMENADFKALMTTMKKTLKAQGLEVQKSTRKGVIYYTLVQF
jgi:hypothetical protein